MFQSTSARVALLSTTGLVLYQIELRDNILEYQIVIVVPTVTKIWGQYVCDTAKVIFKVVPWCISVYEY